MDIRLRRLIEDVVFPSGKEGMSPRSLAHLRLVLADKSNSTLFATFPKCGWNWTGDILGYCAIKKYTGDYELKFEGGGTVKERQRKPMRIFTPADSRSAGRRKVSAMLPGMTVDYCFHTHGYWRDSPLWRLDSARTIFITRNIPTSLFSYYKSKLQIKDYASFESFLADGSLDRAIIFHNSWGAFKKRLSNFRCFKYEDMRAEPAARFAEIYEYAFRQTIDADILAEALDFYSFEKQKQREIDLKIDDKNHFHFKGQTSYEKEIAPETMEMIRTRLKNELTDNFGYEY